MTLRRSVLLGVVLAAVTAGGISCERSVRPESEVLVLVTIDTLRADRLGCGGDGRARTPFLDRLARQGTQMAVTIAPAPLTLPSHATILSGLLPPEHGARDNRTFRVPDDVPLISESFQEEGWATAAFIAAVPLADRFGLARGFDFYGDTPAEGEAANGEAPPPFIERSADRVNRAALGWIDGSDAAGPLFLWIHYYDPHTPYAPPRALNRLEGGDAYRAEITVTDRELGRLTRELGDRYGTQRLCVTSDHGESLGEHGEATHGVFIYESTTRVPWILHGPGVPAARIGRRAASLTEVAPVVLGWAGLGSPDLSSFLASLDVESDETIYTESLYPEFRHGWSRLLALRTPTWKVVRAPNPEIYDLVRDPGETENLYASEEVREQAGDLLEELEDPRWIGRTPDALPADSEIEEALRALGYVGTSPAADEVDGPLPDPKDRIRIEILLSRATSALQSGQPAMARRVASLALSVDSRNKETHLFLARVEAESGNLARALQILDYCLTIPPASADATVHYDRGRVALDLGRLDVAEESFGRAVGEEPLNVSAHFNWGVVAYRAGRMDDAAKRWRETLRLEPDHGPARKWLADAESRLAKAGS